MESADDRPRSAFRNIYAAVPARLVIGIQCFMATWCGFIVRISISLLLLAMVHPPFTDSSSGVLLPVSGSTNKTMWRKADVPDYGPRYNWSQSIQGHVLAAYFYGSTVAPLLGGMLSEVIGSRLVVGFTSFGAAVFTMLHPIAAEAGVGWLIVTRVFTGFLAGALYPSLHHLVAQWGPPQEKGKFVWSLFGGTFGAVVTWPICSAITEAMGWSAAFYITGSIVAVWSVSWLLTVYDSPSKHPGISAQELEYITTSIAGSVTMEKGVVPFAAVMTSSPFMALVALHVGNLAGIFFHLTEGPKYMVEVLGFTLQKAGGYSSVPHLMRLISAVFFSVIGDWCIYEKSLNKTMVRKVFVISSHIIPGVLMAAMGYAGNSRPLAVSLLSLSMGFNGAAITTNLANHHDLSPNFAGSLYGIMDTIGNCTGFLFPALVGYILQERDTCLQWRTIFFIASGLYLVGGIVFIIFGSGETQPWNFKEQEVAPS